jgi:hypothetical protein
MAMDKEKDRAMTNAIPRRVSEMTEIERRYSEAMHELCGNEPDNKHTLEAHEPFDIDEDDEPWVEFEAALERHGLRLVLADDTVVLAAEAAALPAAPAGLTGEAVYREWWRQTWAPSFRTPVRQWEQLTPIEQTAWNVAVMNAIAAAEGEPTA